MEFSIKVTATQLVKRTQEFDENKKPIKKVETFLGQEVKVPYENPICFVPGNGSPLEVKEGYWVVEYPDGYKEVWHNDQIEQIKPKQEPDLAEDVRVDDETPQEPAKDAE